MQSADGGRWRVSVGNDGQLGASRVADFDLEE
jgi:hypothetical protein